MSRWRDQAQPVEVLEPEAWDVPGSLSDGEWRVQSGWDGRCPFETHDEEDER